MKIDKEKLIEMKRERKSNAECAKVFGCSTDAVRLMCKKLEAEGRMTPAIIGKAEDYIAEKRLQTEDDEICYEPVVLLPAEEERKTVAERLAEEEEETILSPADSGDPAAEPAQNVRYPTPPIDRKTFWDMRRDELRGAICEYACEGLRIDPEWVEEYNELVARYGSVR